MSSITLARPYAKAVFAIAKEEDKLPQWSAFLSVLAKVLLPLQSALQDPRVGEVRIAALLVENIDSLSKTQQQFIALLAEKRRLMLMSAIVNLFEQFRADLEKRLHVKMITAYPLTSTETAVFTDSLTKRFKQTIVLENSIDPSILGGAIIRAGDQVIDGSVRAKLVKLHQEIVSDSHACA